MSAPATFDKGGTLPTGRALIYLPPQTRRDRWATSIAMKAWVGRRRRVGLSHWEGQVSDLPLVQWCQTGAHGQVFRAPTALKWIRIPGTGWCLSTYRRN